MLRGETVDPREMKEKVRKNDRSCSQCVEKSPQSGEGHGLE